MVTALCEFLPPTSLLLDVSQFAFWAFNCWLSTSGHMRSLSSSVSEIDCESLSVTLFVKRPPTSIYPRWIVDVLLWIAACWLLCVFNLFSPPFSFLVRTSVSAASITSPHADPPVPNEPPESPSRKLSVKSKTCQDLGAHNNAIPQSPPLHLEEAVRHALTCLHSN